ncbi:MAG: DUF1704 domain-containing protein [Halofilum sp. (in: g-proteobacteria)]|nr:DUF1704 domain-containing protein [Halofilum sp. (in: g-proteobacteria)]
MVAAATVATRRFDRRINGGLRRRLPPVTPGWPPGSDLPAVGHVADVFLFHRPVGGVDQVFLRPEEIAPHDVPVALEAVAAVGRENAIALGRADLLRLLFVGKLDLEDISALAELSARGLCRPPRFLPPWAGDLRFLLSYLAYSTFLNGIDMSRLREHYAELARAAPPVNGIQRGHTPLRSAFRTGGGFGDSAGIVSQKRRFDLSADEATEQNPKSVAGTVIAIMWDRGRHQVVRLVAMQWNGWSCCVEYTQCCRYIEAWRNSSREQCRVSPRQPSLQHVYRDRCGTAVVLTPLFPSVEIIYILLEILMFLLFNLLIMREYH